MKQLSLIRHANAASGHGSMRDIKRPLSQRGEMDAQHLAQHLYKTGFAPDILISSPATRAAATAETIARGVGYDPSRIQWEEMIYDADPADLMTLISNIIAQHNTVALVGHNPAISELSNRLQNRPLNAIPPGSVVTIEFPIAQWSEIGHSTGTLQRFETPKMLH